MSFIGCHFPNQYNDREDQRRGEVPSFVVSRMGSRGREIEIPSPGVLSLFVHFLMGKRTRASAACERPFSGLLIPPRLLGVSPAALVGRNNPAKKVCSQVLHSFHRADLRRIEAQTADNTFVFSRAATKSWCKSACENRQRLISSCPCTSKEKMDTPRPAQKDNAGGRSMPPLYLVAGQAGGQQALPGGKKREKWQKFCLQLPFLSAII